MTAETLGPTQSPHQRIVAFYESRLPQENLTGIRFPEEFELSDGARVFMTRYEIKRTDLLGNEYLSDTIDVRISAPEDALRSTAFSIDQFGLVGVDIRDVHKVKLRKSSPNGSNSSQQTKILAEEQPAKERISFQAQDRDMVDWFDRAVREDTYFMPDIENTEGSLSQLTRDKNNFLRHARINGTVRPAEYIRRLQELGLPEPTDEEVAEAGRNLPEPPTKRVKGRKYDLWPKQKDQKPPKGEAPKVTP